MLFEHKYKGGSAVHSDSSAMGLQFAPDALREPTFFVGDLQDTLTFREAISALHHVVTADFKYRPSNKDDYRTWLKEQEPIWLAEAMEGTDDLELRIKTLQAELSQLQAHKSKITGPYYKAQREYFNYLYQRDLAAWYVLDPVITVHPDQLFFECFSQDESVYGKLSCSHNVFKRVEEFKCGTTNIDYSNALYLEFQKLRSYKETNFVIDPTGFDVQTGSEENFKEVKIDLPDSWMRGFLQVSSAMVMNQVSFDLHPTDIANFIFVLKRNKERQGPRAIRYILKPGEPIEAIFEPWNKKIICPRSIYKGDRHEEIRVWGRRRITLLERLLPIAKNFSVRLLGTGLPSFYIADLGDMEFTLGLSGWSANDWTESSRLDLLAPSGMIDSKTMESVYMLLKNKWLASSKEIAYDLSMDEKDVTLALRKLTQAGKVIYDLSKGVYRLRELKNEGIDIEKLRFSSDIEKEGHRLYTENAVRLNNTRHQDNGMNTQGVIDGSFVTDILISKDERIIDGTCQCSHYYAHKLKQGPCEHMIALRLRLNKEIKNQKNYI